MIFRAAPEATACAVRRTPELLTVIAVDMGTGLFQDGRICTSELHRPTGHLREERLIGVPVALAGIACQSFFALRGPAVRAFVLPAVGELKIPHLRLAALELRLDMVGFCQGEIRTQGMLAQSARGIGPGSGNKPSPVDLLGSGFSIVIELALPRH